MPKFTSFFFFKVGVKMGLMHLSRGVCNYYRLKQQTFFSSYKQYRDCISARSLLPMLERSTHRLVELFFIVHPKCTKQLTIDNNKILLWGVCFVGETRAICFLIHISSFLFPDVIPSTVVLSMTFLFQISSNRKNVVLGYSAELKTGSADNIRWVKTWWGYWQVLVCLKNIWLMNMMLRLFPSKQRLRSMGHPLPCG